MSHRGSCLSTVAFLALTEILCEVSAQHAVVAPDTDADNGSEHATEPEHSLRLRQGPREHLAMLLMVDFPTVSRCHVAGLSIVSAQASLIPTTSSSPS